MSQWHQLRDIVDKDYFYVDMDTIISVTPFNHNGVDGYCLESKYGSKYYSKQLPHFTSVTGIYKPRRCFYDYNSD